MPQNQQIVKKQKEASNQHIQTYQNQDQLIDQFASRQELNQDYNQQFSNQLQSVIGTNLNTFVIELQQMQNIVGVQNFQDINQDQRSINYILNKSQKKWFKEMICCIGSSYTIDDYSINIVPNFGIHSVCFGEYTIKISNINNDILTNWKVNYSKFYWKMYQDGVQIIYYPPYFEITDFRNDNQMFTYFFQKAKWCRNAKIFQGKEIVAEFIEISKISINARNIENLLLLIPIVVFIDQQNLQFFS